MLRSLRIAGPGLSTCCQPSPLAPYHQNRVRSEQRSNDYSRRKYARKMPAIENRHAQHCACIGFLTGDCQALYLPVCQALLLTKRIDRAGMPVEHTLVERAYPQIGFCARERCDKQTIQRGMQG